MSQKSDNDPKISAKAMSEPTKAKLSMTRPPNSQSSASSMTPLPIQYFKIHQFPTSNCTDRLTYMLIRPPKLTYDQRLLVPPLRDPRFRYCVQKIPFPLSIYTPAGCTPDYYLLYLHGNSSSRLEGSSMLRFLPPNVGLACFDFDGCGNRDGEWITLGINESKEVDTAVEHLSRKGYTIVVWGRSMGAVSALMSDKASIVISDSAFSSLKRVCFETAVRNAKYVPHCLISCAFPCVYSILKKQIHKKTNCDIDELDVLSRVSKMSEQKSIMFLSGLQDEMISTEHSKELFEVFKGNKEKCWFEGSHNSTRTKEVYDKCFKWVEKCLAIRQEQLPKLGVEPSELRLTDRNYSQLMNCGPQVPS